MFEKEAEEYKDNTKIKDENTYIGFPNERISELQDFEGNYIDISERIIKAFKDGAEFGYNKANEEAMMKLKDEEIVKPLKDSILRNQRLSSQEQQELCAWIECAMDFGEKLDECAEKLAGAERTKESLRLLGFPTFQSCKEYADKMNYAKTIIQDLLSNSDEYARQRAIDFLKGE